MAARQHPHYLMGVLTLLLAFVAGSFIHSALPPGNPEGTDAEEITKKVLDHRRRLDEKATGDVSKEKIESFSKDGQCVLELMNLSLTEEPPGNPQPPQKPSSYDPRRQWDYQAAKKEHAWLVANLERRKKVWTENKETQDNYVIALINKKEVKYIYFPNLFGYVEEERLNYVVSVFKAMSTAPNWKGQLGWLDEGFKEYQKKNPSKKEAWKEYLILVYLGQPLVCPKLADGITCMKTWYGTTKEDRDGGADCLLVKPLAEAITRANARMKGADKGEITPMICWRSNFHQAVLYTAITGSGCNLSSARDGITLPGISLHGFGLAMDVAGGKQAGPFLAIEAGMLGNIIKNDKDHWSLGEFSPNERKYSARKMYWDSVATGGSILDIFD